MGAKVTPNHEEREHPETALDSMLRRFKKRVNEERIVELSKTHEYFLCKSLKRKDKARRARMRNNKKKRRRG